MLRHDSASAKYIDTRAIHQTMYAKFSLRLKTAMCKCPLVYVCVAGCGLGTFPVGVYSQEDKLGYCHIAVLLSRGLVILFIVSAHSIML